VNRQLRILPQQGFDNLDVAHGMTVSVPGNVKNQRHNLFPIDLPQESKPHIFIKSFQNIFLKTNLFPILSILFIHFKNMDAQDEQDKSGRENRTISKKGLI
jgi:hypothetical protein